jgi:hypothetical protein
MLAQKRLKSLQNKSELIARRIEMAERSPYVDSTILRGLKKQKLQLKQVIEGIAEDKLSTY